MRRPRSYNIELLYLERRSALLGTGLKEYSGTMNSLDNYKGIMLCDPPEGASYDNLGAPPFRPSSGTDQLSKPGWTPFAKVRGSIKKQQVTIYHKHNAYMKGMVDTLEREKDADADRACQKHDKHERVKAFGTKLRNEILHNMDVAELDEEEKQRLQREVEQLVDDVMQQASSQAHQTVQEAAAPQAAVSPSKEAVPEGTEGGKGVMLGTSTGLQKAKASKGKPAWALTAEEVLSKEEQEEAALLDFADNLDFDSYVSHLDDVQLQEALQELETIDKGGDDHTWKKRFVQSMNSLANRKALMAAAAATRPNGEASESGRADECMSTASRSTAAASRSCSAPSSKCAATTNAARAKDEPQWEGSTKADGHTHMGVVAVARQADDFLRENPELRAVHSHASIRSLMSAMEGCTGMAAEA